jgi:hypothetical protein
MLVQDNPRSEVFRREEFPATKRYWILPLSLPGKLGGSEAFSLQLRHSDPRVTLGMYSHGIGEDRRNAVERVAALLRPVAPKSGAQEEWIQ